MMDFLEGALPGDVRAEFEEHRSVCAGCVEYLTHCRDAVEMGKAVFRDADTALPTEVPPDLVAAILAARRTSAI
jgi:hypothetical protein